jgi:hypothetical protein
MQKELENLKKHKSMLEAQVEALKLQINRLPCSCHMAKETFYPHERPPVLDLYTNQNQGSNSMGYPPYYVKREESPVASSTETQETCPTTNPFEDTESLGYYHHNTEQHQVGSGEYGHPSKYYQHSFGPSAVAHPRPNGFYYHPYYRK